MSICFLQCPSCQEEFSSSSAETQEELLTCPKCGVRKEKKAFFQLFFCPGCKKIFREKEQQEKGTLICPYCRREISEKEAPGLSSSDTRNSFAGFRMPPLPAGEDRRLLKDGEIFDKYKIIRLLGRGGMAEVYLAEHMILGHHCALKCLLPVHSSRQEDNNSVRKRFIREAKLAREISHPNIVSIYDAGCEEKSGILFIVMEYIEGETLAQLAEKNFSEKELLQIAYQMAKALEALEKCRIVHRDIKPSNIMRQTDGAIKLMDLGIAKSGNIYCGGEYPFTADKSVFGTPAYASPEQCQDSHKTDSRSDIYSLGATLYHLATGKQPHNGSTPVEIICRVLKDDPESLAKLRPDLTGKTRELIEKMMAKDPEQRPGDPALLQKKIRKIGGRGVASFRESLPEIPKSFFTFFILLLFLGGAAFFLPSFFSRQEKPRKAPEVIRQTPVPFREIDFRKGEEKRTLANRLREVRRILAFLEAPGNRTLFHRKRLEMYREREHFLSNLLRKKEARLKKRKKTVFSRERVRITSDYIRNRRIPFRCSAGDRQFGLQLLVDVYNGQLDPNAVFANFRGEKYPLLYHVLNGILVPCSELFKGLIREGADVDFSSGPSPLANWNGAILFNNSQETPPELLLRSGRDDVDHFWHLPILPACFEKRRNHSHSHIIINRYNWSLAEFLVDSGCLTEVRNNDGKTIAHFAAAADKALLLEKLLLSSSPALTAKDDQGLTPWHYAVRNGSGNVINLLEKFRIPPEEITEKDHAQKELLSAIRSGDTAAADKALQRGADLQFVYGEGLNALQNAIRFRQPELVEFFLKKGAGVRDNESHMSSLEIAIRTRQPRIFKLLLDKWTPPDWFIIDSGGQAEYLPYRIVCSCHMDPTEGRAFLEILLERNWQINDSPSGGMGTVLHCALHHRNLHPHLLKYLLEKGADPNRKNNWNKTAFEVTGNPVFLSILKKYKNRRSNTNH